MRPLSLRSTVALTGWGAFAVGLFGVFQASNPSFWACWSLLGAAGFITGALVARRWAFWAIGIALLFAFAPSWEIFQETIARFIGGHDDVAGVASAALFLWEGIGFLLLAWGLRLLARLKRPWAVPLGAGLGILLLEGLWPKQFVWSWVASWQGLPLLPRAAAFLGARGLSVALWAGSAVLAQALAQAVLVAEARPERRKTALLDGLMAGLPGPGAVLVLFALLGVAWEWLPRGPERSVDLLLVQPMILPEGRMDTTEMILWTQTDTALHQYELPQPGRPCLVAWPESALAGPGYAEGQGQGLERAAKRGVAWTFGAMAVRGEGLTRDLRSVVHFYDPGVGTPQTYLRVSLYPWVEGVPGPAQFRDWLAQRFGQISYQAGTLGPESSFRWRVGPGPEDILRVHPLLCSEATLPGRVQAGVARAGADLLLNPSNEVWLGDTVGPGVHGAYTAFRAVEMGVPLVRVTNSGPSGIFREDGSGGQWGEPLRRETYAAALTWRVVYTPMRHPAWSWGLVGLLGLGFVLSLLPGPRRG